jgi:hypothetical protein
MLILHTLLHLLQQALFQRKEEEKRMLVRFIGYWMSWTRPSEITLLKLKQKITDRKISIFF